MEKGIRTLFVDIKERLKKHRTEQYEFAAPTRRLCDFSDSEYSQNEYIPESRGSDNLLLFEYRREYGK